MTSPVPPAPNFPGRQTCSSTPRLSTPTSRAVSAARRAASTARASQRACQSTSRRRASAATVVSSYSSASAAHTTARPVSSARGARHRVQPRHHCAPLQGETGISGVAGGAALLESRLLGDCSLSHGRPRYSTHHEVQGHRTILLCRDALVRWSGIPRRNAS